MNNQTSLNPRDLATHDHARLASRPRSHAEVQLSSNGLGWKLLEYERREVGPSYLSLPAGSNRHLVFLILEGGMLERESIEGKVRHRLAPGFVTILPRAHPVRWSWDSRLSFSLLALQPEFLQYVAEHHLGITADKASLHFSERRVDSTIAGIAATLANETLRADAGTSFYVDSLAAALAVHLLRGEPPGPIAATGQVASSPRAINRAISFIQENYPEHIGLAEIAAAARLSPFYFSRLFKKVLGVTLHEYLIQTRVQNARALIIAGGKQYSLAEIATAVGFADQSHLTRHFKRLLGTTPKKIT